MKIEIEHIQTDDASLHLKTFQLFQSNNTFHIFLHLRHGIPHCITIYVCNLCMRFDENSSDGNSLCAAKKSISIKHAGQTHTVMTRSSKKCVSFQHNTDATKTEPKIQRSMQMTPNKSLPLIVYPLPQKTTKGIVAFHLKCNLHFIFLRALSLR